MKEKLTHFDNQGNAVMVDVSEKNKTVRVATATGKIMAIKKTSDLIPMCHPIMISGCNIDFEIDEENSQIIINSTVKIFEKTGVEMEALTGVSVAALTIYDMCKAVDKRMKIDGIHLVKKTGGKSGEFNY